MPSSPGTLREQTSNDGTALYIGHGRETPGKRSPDGRLIGRLNPNTGEILTKQRDIYCAMDVQAPESIASLCIDAGM